MFTMVLREDLVGAAAEVQKTEIIELLASPMLKAVSWSVLNLDLSAVQKVDSVGTRVLEDLHKQMSPQRLQVRVSNASDPILRILLEAGLDRTIEIHKTGTPG